MPSLIGQLSLYAALFFAFLQSVPPLIGYYRNNPYLLALARPATIAQFIFVLMAYFTLTIAFSQNDFSLFYVAGNSHPQLPFIYKITAVWGGHEGSILLWILLLASWALSILYLQRNQKEMPVTLSIMGLISLCFLLFLLFTSNPFQASLYQLEPADLNPLLQDPGFVIHPPILYTGYVGFSAAFATTLAALITKKLDANWVRTTRILALSSWAYLTLGITLGSWWAYRVLGWGGFWFRDPVENASLLPWIAGTALIHVLLLVSKRDTAKGWAAILALITFSLSVLGTFLVRSGLLVSAHTFANDPARGIFLLLLLAVLATLALTIYIKRLPEIQNAPVTFTLLSRETSLLVNSLLLFVIMITILLGTLYPLIIDALQLGTLSVGAPYFNTVMPPFIFLMMTLMGFGVLSRSQKENGRELWLVSYKKILLSVVLAFSLLFFGTQTINIMAALSLSLSFWVILSVRAEIRKKSGMAVAHIGFALLIIGIMLSSTLNQQREVRIKPGESVEVGPYQFFFIDDVGMSGPNYRGIRAEFEVLKNTRHITNLYPEKRIYGVRNMIMTTVDIHPGIFRDLYIALGEPLDANYWSVRIYYKPFIRWIWVGGVLMMIGGIISMFNVTKVSRKKA